MKKNFLTVAALMVTAFFVATEIAQAADVSFSGQIRTRYEVKEQNDFDKATTARDYTESRVKLNAKVNINDSTSAFIQLQGNRTWGETSSSNSFTANDNSDGVGLHQAYFTLKNFASLPVDLKMGRQEIILDGHRLFGHTGWTTGAQTHDALRLTHAHDNMVLGYSYIAAQETARTGGQNNADRNDQGDIDVHLAYFSYAGILGGKFSATYAYMMDECGRYTSIRSGNISTGGAVPGNCREAHDSIHTIGGRQAGQLFGVDYRGEAYYQWGDANGLARNVGRIPAGHPTLNKDFDRSAYMFGVRLGKSFKNVMMKPSLTLWYDYLSGTSDKDGSENKMKSFDTLFDTGHKFYGFMDQYLAVGRGGGTRGLGLQDAVIKAKFSPMPGWTMKGDYHWFWTAEGVAGSPSSGLAGKNDSGLGNELDLTLVHKYNANTNISFGYSVYTTSAAYRVLKRTGPDAANWGYVMFDVKF